MWNYISLLCALLVASVLKMLFGNFSQYKSPQLAIYGVSDGTLSRITRLFFWDHGDGKGAADMITWAEKVAWVGFEVEPRTSSGSFFEHSIKLRRNPGRCSYGEGDTLEEAIEDAAWGMNIDWWSVERRITEHEWEKMSHL